MVKLLILNGPPGSGRKSVATLIHRKLGEIACAHMRIDKPLRNHVYEILGLSEDYLLDGVMHKQLELLNGHTPAVVMMYYRNKHLWPMFGIPVLAKWLVKAIWLNDYQKKHKVIIIPDLLFECELSVFIDFIRISGGDPLEDILLMRLDRKGCQWLTGIDSGHAVSSEGKTREFTACTDSIDAINTNSFTEIETILKDLIPEWSGVKYS